LLYAGARDRGSAVSAADARSILIVRLDTLGDLILMTPFLRELRRLNGSAWITLIVDDRFANAVELCPYVNEVRRFPGVEGGRIRQTLRAVRFARKHLWKRRFELAMLPRWDADPYSASLLTYVSRASWRMAYSEHVSRNKSFLNRGADTLFNRTLNDAAPKHEMKRNLEFLLAAGGVVVSDSLELWLGEEDRRAAKQALHSSGIKEHEPLIAIAPGAGHAKRRWPLDRFIELGRLLVRECATKIVVVGGEQDRPAAAQLAEELGASGSNLAGQLTIRQTGAVLECTRLMIANDSGPMHLAAAAGIPVVEISCHPADGDASHTNAPQRFHPWSEEYEVLQPLVARAPCFGACEWNDAHCILGVSVEMVIEAVRRLWGKTRAAAGRASEAPHG
jgi:ADP-heptose:LPS heptosyltransferase